MVEPKELSYRGIQIFLRYRDRISRTTWQVGDETTIRQGMQETWQEEKRQIGDRHILEETGHK